MVHSKLHTCSMWLLSRCIKTHVAHVPAYRNVYAYKQRTLHHFELKKSLPCHPVTLALNWTEHEDIDTKDIKFKSPDHHCLSYWLNKTSDEIKAKRINPTWWSSVLLCGTFLYTSERYQEHTVEDFDTKQQNRRHRSSEKPRCKRQHTYVSLKE